MLRIPSLNTSRSFGYVDFDLGLVMLVDSENIYILLKGLQMGF